MAYLEIPTEPGFSQDIEKCRIDTPVHADYINAFLNIFMQNDVFLKNLAQEIYVQSTEYADKGIADLLGGAQEDMDTIKELGDCIAENRDAMDVLNAAIAKKANQAELNSHTGNGTIHITTSERNNWNGKANQTDLSSHAGNGTIHLTASERNIWNKKVNQKDFNDYSVLMEKIVNTKASVDAIKDLSNTINGLYQKTPKYITAEVTAQNGNVYIPSCTKVLSVQNSNAAISADCILAFVLQNATTLYYTKNAGNRTQITIVYV